MALFRMSVAVMALACLATAVSAAAESRRVKQQRPTRGFKNVEMMTARGFGKRDHPQNRAERDVSDVQQSPAERASRGTPTFKSPSVGIARDFGKRTPEEFQYAFPSPRRRFNPKTTLMVAPDFGKRATSEFEDTDSTDEASPKEVARISRAAFKPGSKVLIARAYGKRNSVYGLDNFWEMLESSPEKENLVNDDKPFESIPFNWFVNEMLNNPDFARSVVRKFIDLNQDGMLSSDELLRNV